jgi:transposase
MSDRENAALSTGYIPAARSMPDRRRNFRLGDKKRIVAEAMAPGASVSLVARRYGISKPLLFRWKRELAPPGPEPTFLPLTVDDGIAASPPAMPSPQAAVPIIIERSSHEIEIELTGGSGSRVIPTLQQCAR